MKKLMLTVAAFAAVTMVSSAASMAWNTSVAKFDGTAITANLSSYLIYLGTSSEISDVTIDGNTKAADIISAVGTDTGSTGSVATSGMSKGKVSGTLNPVPATYSDGDYFAVLLALQQDGKTYFNLSTAQASKYNAATAVWSALATTGWSMDTVGESTTLKAKGGWTYASVPEPATGALALAGIALLFRRRKA